MYVRMYIISTVSSSVVNATVTLNTPDQNRQLYSITVTCTIHPNSMANTCVVMAVAGQETYTGKSYVI